MEEQIVMQRDEQPKENPNEDRKQCEDFLKFEKTSGGKR